MTDDNSPEQTASGHDLPSTRLRLRYDGETTAMWGIAIVNLLLNIVTLGFYRFWGRTKIRRYVWAHLRVNNEPLHYSGLGIHLFLGFLVVVFIFFPVVFAIQFAMQIAAQSGYVVVEGILVIILLSAAFFLFGFAIYQARRYRLGHTNWRGIRGGMKGGAVQFAIRLMWFYFGLGLTLGWIYPLMRQSLFGRLMRETEFGDASFDFQGSSKPLYKAFAMAWLISLLAVVAGVGTSVAAFSLSEEVADEPSLAAMGAAFLAIILAYSAIGLAFVYYRGREFTHFARCTTFNGLQFRLEITYWQLCRLYLGNIALLIVTLGIGGPVAQQRVFRFFFNHLESDGEMDFEALRQSAMAKPARGEGLAEMFDLGTI